MLTIGLRFVGGRYHATPWGRHVNEAVPEWPPSPYRLIRALYDVWKRKLPEWGIARVEALLEKLGSEPPKFLLPKAGASHTRSYLHKNTEDPTDKTLIFDGFVTVNPAAPVLMHWPEVELTEEQKQDLDEMLQLLNFLGRSESWVAARVTEEIGGWNCIPATEAEHPGELVSVACAVPKAEFRRAGGRVAPRDWLEALTYSTTQMLKETASHPPALRTVEYARDRAALNAGPAERTSRAPRQISAVLYGLSGKVLPRMTQAVEIAEQVRTRLMGIHKKIHQDDETKVSWRFSGHYADGRPVEGHQHCFILPFAKSAKRRGLIDQILVWCRTPFEADELLALGRLVSLYQSEGKPDIHCVPVGWSSGAGLRRTYRIVESATPFVPPRHYRRGRGEFMDWLVKELKRECGNHDLDEPRVELMESSATGLAWRSFRRSRAGERARYGFGFRLEFPTPVYAPFSLGYGCHFGLGQFHGVRA